MSSELSTDQQNALATFRRWLHNGGREFRLGGLAGTGKTTLIKKIRPMCGDCDVVTPSAKAAQILMSKGIPARTMHLLMKNYLFSEIDKDGKESPVFSDKDFSCDYLIVDEASMVNKEMALSAREKSARIVWVGDYGQLPPVEKDGAPECIMAEELLDAKLTTQHRHTGSDDIIDFALYLRQGGAPHVWESSESGQVKIGCAGINANSIGQYLLRNEIWPVICFTNEARAKINKIIRRLSGRTEEFYPGLRIICTRNDYRSGIVNGQTMTVLEADGRRITTELGEFVATFDKGDGVKVEDGYAITCHKAQGSEWDRVAVIEDIPSFPQWRYTAATRAKSMINWLSGDVIE